MLDRRGINKNHTLKVGVAVSTMLMASLSTTIAQDFAINTAQADRGVAIYDEHCSGCHGSDMNGGNAPELKGGLFIIHWGGKPVSDLFTYVRENMPAGSPGSLHSDDYRDVIADILRANGYPTTADAAEMTKDTDLTTVLVEDKTK